MTVPVKLRGAFKTAQGDKRIAWVLRDPYTGKVTPPVFRKLKSARLWIRNVLKEGPPEDNPLRKSSKHNRPPSGLSKAQRRLKRRRARLGLEIARDSNAGNPLLHHRVKSNGFTVHARRKRWRRART